VNKVIRNITPPKTYKCQNNSKVTTVTLVTIVTTTTIVMLVTMVTVTIEMLVTMVTATIEMLVTKAVTKMHIFEYGGCYVCSILNKCEYSRQILEPSPFVQLWAG
jgi:hypothetical protein